MALAVTRAIGAVAIKLSGRLLHDFSAGFARTLERYPYGPGAFKVDWALDGPVPWSTPPDTAPGTVHVAETVEEVALAGAQINAGAVPADPWSRPYQYLNPGLKGEVDVLSLGADGQPGGENRDADVGSWQ